jgi:hypothetical protein
MPTPASDFADSAAMLGDSPIPLAAWLFLLATSPTQGWTSALHYRWLGIPRVRSALESKSR